jgi:TonB-linked SusC/RagA family outer membrane protein
LYLRTEFGYDFTNQLEERFFGSLTQEASTNGFGDALDDKEENFVFNNFLQYQYDREKWRLEATLGMAYEELLVKSVFVEGRDFPSDQLRKLASAGEITDGGTLEQRVSLVSYFARANATLFDRWLLKASIRVDGSSRFGADSKYGTFPAASLGWLASNESFLKDSKAISNLKLRASWGITGNANTNPFASRTEFNTTIYDREAGFFLDRLGDPELSWEKTEQFNIGLDFGIFNNRLNTSIDYYNKYTDGLLNEVPIPASNGIRSVVRNIAEIQNTGFEWVLDATNISTENFSWNTALNLAFNTNEVKVLPDGADISRGTRIVREGETVASFYLVEYAGVDPENGDALFYLNTELPDGSLDRSTTNDFNAASRRILGNPFPDVIGGLTNSFRYRGIDFSFTFQGEWGAQLYNGGGIFQSTNADFFDNQTRDQLNRWQQPGDITNVPQARLFAGNGSQRSSRYLEDGDFIRLRNLTLGYTLPIDITERIGMDRIRFYFTGVNLLTITDYTGWDPESTADYTQLNSASSGFVFYSPPQARTLTFGINVDF